MRDTPKTPPKPKPAPARRNEGSTTPDPARIDMAMGILGPLEANAPTDA